MEFNKHYYQISGLCPLPNVPKRTQCFGNCVCFHPQVKRWGPHIQLGQLERASGLG
jgi:hypothetical protein